MDNTKKEVLHELTQVKKKLELVLSSINKKPNKTKYMTAQDIQAELGIDQRTILNRSNLPRKDRRYIPSLQIGGRRKYFERKVIDRLLKVNK